jgi:hypothetical protein
MKIVHAEAATLPFRRLAGGVCALALTWCRIDPFP